MKNSEAVIAEIEAKVEKMINLHEAVKKQNADLSGLVQKLQQTVDEQKSRISELEENLKITNLAKSLTGLSDEGKSVAKQRINELVKEIDKCLAQLNR
jgi:predicted  nucleic acid-binding Zn-ribbon protein